MRAQSPTEFLDMWGSVEGYQKYIIRCWRVPYAYLYLLNRFIHEIRLSIGANKITDDMVEEFRRRLSDFDPASVSR